MGMRQMYWLFYLQHTLPFVFKALKDKLLRLYFKL